MELLENRIKSDGTVKAGNILKVDNFLNHQVDISFIMQLSKEFKRLFSNAKPDKVITIEASGIRIAALTAAEFSVPMIFAKKAKSANLGDDVYVSNVHSYTYDKDYKITVEKRFINRGEKILIIDDFLAIGNALSGLLDILDQAQAEVVGIGIAVEKGFQGGGDKLRAAGYNVQSLAIIDSMDENNIIFRK